MRYTKTFQNALGDFLVYLLNWMELTEWRIRLIDGYPESTTTAACIKGIYGTKFAQLQLSQDFFKYSMKDQQHFLVHEVCHLYSETIDSLIVNDLSSIMGMPAYTMFHSAYTLAMETMTDQLAFAISGLMEDQTRYRMLLDNIEMAEKGELPPPVRDYC